jgi:RimJ/RimL family protein N-acetyltransferase
MRLTLATCIVRSWEGGDARSIARHANNREVWLHLRDRFPHPYSERDAAQFIARARSAQRETNFAIEVNGEAAGGIGFLPGTDIERVSAEIGYWLGQAHWGRGLVTEALRAVTAYAVDAYGLTRVFAVPFAHNIASCRVLEKAGYQLEGCLRRSAIKDGRICDQRLYAFVPHGTSTAIAG